MDVRKPLILVVDDNDDLRELFIEMIDSLGFAVASARHGAEAMRMLPDVRPGVVLLDMNMPELDGPEFLAQLRGMSTPAAPVVIAMSADRGFDSLSKDLGALDFVEKPIDAALLRAVLVQALRGGAINAEDRSRHRERVLKKLAADATRRDEILRCSCIDGAGLHREVAAMLRWLSGYFEMPIAFTVLLRDERPTVFEFQGVSGYPPGTEVSDRFCATLTRNSESLLLRDASAHPLYCGQGDARGTYAGYLSAPIRTREGISLGTLGFKSPQPIDAAAFRAEDLRLVRYFADAFGECVLRSVAEPNRPPGLFADPALIDDAAFRAVVASRVSPSSADAYPFTIAELVGERPDFVAEVRRVLGALGPRRRLAIAFHRQQNATVTCLGSAEQLTVITNMLRSLRQSFKAREERIGRPVTVDVVAEFLAAK